MKKINCLIDDDSIYLFAMKRILKNLRPEDDLLQFTNPTEALAYFADANSRCPDLVMIDLNMPIMDGWQLVQQLDGLNLRWPNPPQIYMVSSSIDDIDRQKASNTPLLTGFLSKPIAEEELRRILINT